MSDLPPFTFDLSEGSYQTTSEFNQMSACVMPVMVVGDDQLELVGTAFSFTTGYIMTATHVLDVIVDRVMEHPSRWGAVFMLKSGEVWGDALFGAMLPISKITIPGAASPSARVRSDIGIAQLRLPTDIGTQQIIQPGHLSLSFLPPAVGERVLALGYPHWSATFSDGNLSDLIPTMGKAVGEVEEIWPTGRDRILLPQPSFSVGALWTGGMSGGPVVNTQGHVCGVISRGFEMIEGLDSIAFASLLAPTVGFVTEWDDGAGNLLEYDLGYLAKLGWMRTDGTEDRVRFSRNDDGNMQLHMDF